jgi:putative flavoprotein involved in K+ transport
MEAEASPMLARAETDLTITERWLAQFERALSEGDNALLKTLFHADSHWRDVLPLTWRIMTVNGRDAILKELRIHSRQALPHGFKIPPHRTAPCHARWHGIGRGYLLI